MTVTEQIHNESSTRRLGKTTASMPVSLTIDAESCSRALALFREALVDALGEALAKAQEFESAVPPPEPAERSRSPAGVDLTAADRTKAADVRVAFLMGKLPENTGLLIDAKSLAKLLDVSRATMYRLQAEEAIPEPVQLGNLKKWRLGEILDWIEADCPPLGAWIPMKQNASKRKGK
jgi:predicted DNA-binding transcriptional regulator AlpA